MIKNENRIDLTWFLILTRLLEVVSLKQIKKVRALLALFHPDNLLCDILGGGAHSANGQENIIVQEVSGKHLNLLREGSGEHKRLPLAGWRHIILLNDTSNLGLETHVQHTICLVKYQVTAIVQTNPSTAQHVHETSGRSYEQMTAAIELTNLVVDVATTVDNSGTHARSVGELARLVEDLCGELAGRRQHQTQWVLLAPTATRIWRRRRHSHLVDLIQNRHEEGSCLTRARLSAGHHVATSDDDRDSVLLHGRRLVVTGQCNAVLDYLCQLNVFELKIKEIML